ncbi:acetyl-CoA C-acyltransferase [Paenarthrobacter ureafaciens]|uniref:acetyl-CoA C-acyltransferase n=1 Tax=Paenarthrobacter ureafaciens TaxID=37931 RepID=UPI0009AE175E|nr:acetyl-CoA C-acyltransferase [Paenarthrobacter ureafaciens]GLU61527.1 acetyl-CoA acetyltransferase [Paenarthrobacter ureafaciens]GLU65800.1 acetyl-CoA acetyltransferase [Paenarthrobacter ureafaciens]GLU70123.1 acetyl-CoA acetyltransferase [Paenarthrobacter ureafaciens]GLU74359.1 acetyl-CoA acetyltransferase [Paenarthrobacter ureafaciens]GLU78609.1 acetyl-CoA acetyltransferase [Paenarthrobacter ureafaciens]
MKKDTEYDQADTSDIVVIGAARTAQGRLMGQLATLSAVDLGGAAITGALARARIAPAAVDAVIMGQVLQSGTGQNPARQSATAAGIPLRAHAATVNKVCLSGLAAIIEGTRMLRLGDASVVVAGGQESMSQSPRLVAGTRAGMAYGALELEDAAARDGLTDAFTHETMGLATDRANGPLGISREQQDAFAASSHRRASRASQAGVWSEEIVPVKVHPRKGPVVEVTEDEGIRPDVTPEALGRLRPAFSPEGTITAGSASPLTDGAAAVVLCRRGTAERIGLPVLAVLRSYAQIAGPDTTLPDKPAKALQTALAAEAWTVGDLDLIEINEAFASVAIHSAALLGMGPEKINVNGGALALGHPIGASGARLVVTAVHELVRRQSGKAAVALCGGGGQGDALLLER